MRIDMKFSSSTLAHSTFTVRFCFNMRVAVFCSLLVYRGVNRLSFRRDRFRMIELYVGTDRQRRRGNVSVIFDPQVVLPSLHENFSHTFTLLQVSVEPKFGYGKAGGDCMKLITRGTNAL